MNILTPLLANIKTRLSMPISQKLLGALKKAKQILAMYGGIFVIGLLAWVFWVPEGWGLDNIKNAQSMTEFLYILPPAAMISIVFVALMFHCIVVRGWKKQLKRVLQLDFSHLHQTSFAYNDLDISIKKLTEEENKQLFALPLDEKSKQTLINVINHNGYLTYQNIEYIEKLINEVQESTPAQNFLKENNFNVDTLEVLSHNQKQVAQSMNGKRFKDLL